MQEASSGLHSGSDGGGSDGSGSAEGPYTCMLLGDKTLQAAVALNVHPKTRIDQQPTHTYTYAIHHI